MSESISRRSFLSALGTGAASLLTLPGCNDASRYGRPDIEALERQKRIERSRSGKGPYGRQVYRGYRGLADLPYFEIDTAGNLRCVVEDLPPIIDFHAHLGISALFAPTIDWQADTDRVRHFLDCDASTPGCELDLDVYINANFSQDDLASLRRESVAQVTWGSGSASTHTIPNLVQEMDSMGVEQAVIFLTS